MTALADVEELARRDEAAAAALAEVEYVQAQTEHARSRGDELLAFRRTLPAERERRAAAIDEAETALAGATAAREQLEEELRAAAGRRKQQERERLERRVEEARASENAAAAELERMRAAAAHLERDAAQAEADARELEGEARLVAARVAALPRLSHEATAPPGDGLDGVAEWGARVRAPLLLLHAQLAAERDAIIREANEIGSVVLGEALGASSVARVRERVAQAVHRL
jgi:flagellar biosynthesis GTPase FlhF